jgi:hypothetical protein
VDFYWQPLWRVAHWLFVLALLAVMVGVAQRRSVVPALYVLAAGATALTIGKVGSNVNYLLQLWAGLSLAGGLAVGWLESGRWSVVGGQTSPLHGWLATPLSRGERGNQLRSVVAAAGLVVPALWLLVGLQQLHHVPYTLEAGSTRATGPAAAFEVLRWPRLPLWRLDPWSQRPGELAGGFGRVYQENPSAAQWEHARQTHAYIAALDGDILAEEMSFTVTTGKRIYLQPFEFTQLGEQGAWDRAALLDDIRRRHFVAVVLRFRLGDDPAWRRERLNQPVLDALSAAYRLDAQFGDYYVYTPRRE